MASIWSRRCFRSRVDRRPPVRFEAAMQYVRPAEHTFVHGVSLAEVDLAVEKHLQLFVTWFAGNDARHRVAVFVEDPQSLGHALTASLRMFSAFRPVPEVPVYLQCY